MQSADSNFMDVSNVGRFKASMAKLFSINSRGRDTNERDADGRRPFQAPAQVTHLNLEQEKEALAKFNQMLLSRGTGLHAELVRGDNVPTHILVKDAQGQVLRNLPYDQIVQLYLDRHNEKSTGNLIKRAA